MTPMDVLLLFLLSLLLIIIVVEVARRLLLQDLGVFYATVEKKQYVSETTIYMGHGLIYYQDEEFGTYCRLMPRPGYGDNALYRKAHIMHNKDFFMNHAEGDYARVDVKVISIASVIVYVELSPA